MTLNAFSTALNNELNPAFTHTENGALAHSTTGSPLVDFNFKISSYRNCEPNEIVNDFSKVFAQNPKMAVLMLFFAGDIRQGMGERKVFKSCMSWLADNHPEYCNAVIQFIPEYTRWDYAVDMLDGPCDAAAWQLLEKQFLEDVGNNAQNKPVSLLAKWLPSVNASNKAGNMMGKKIAKRLGLKEAHYRKALASLRRRIDVVEVKMSANQWSEIDYNGVPSKANILYRNAFMRHDSYRRSEYLEALARADENVKINSSVSFPYDIVHAYGDSYNDLLYDYDATLEAMWKSLPDYTKGHDTNNVICVVDGSGSMGSSIGNTSITAHDVARSLGIYFSEKLAGPFKDKFITFSSSPKLVDLANMTTLHAKIKCCIEHDECANTDIEKTFMLILNTAIHSELTQDQLPGTVLVISDMEFDEAVGYNADYVNKTLFDFIRMKYEQAGYKLPRLVFWNVNSRTGAIPVQENEQGVTFVSGFSPTIASMVFSNKLDPEEVLLDKLQSERYKPIAYAISDIA